MIKIQAQGIGKRFNREWIFRNLTAEFTSDHVYAITGPNGSGKSTFLQVLSGQMPVSEGRLTYYVDDKPVEADQVYQMVSIAAPYLDLIDEFTLTEQLRFHFTGKEIQPGFTEQSLIEKMYLVEHREKFLVNFSSGMKQRVKLGLALFCKSPVIFLDEPGTNLDRHAFSWYLENLQQSLHGKIVFIASNQPEEYPDNAVRISITDYKT